jgi:hypothetical protein
MSVQGVRRQPIYGQRMASSLTDAAWLHRIEGLLAKPEGKAAGREPFLSRFRCRLEDQPHHLVPKHYLRNWVVEDNPEVRLSVNSSVCFTAGGRIPPQRPEIASLLADFELDGNVVWITDPGTGSVQPFCLESDLAKMLAAMQLGDPPPGSLSAETVRVLANAEVLVPAGWAASRRQQWNLAVARSTAQFQEKGYAAVTRLIHPFHIAELRRYYRYLLRTGRMFLGDIQCPGRRVIHNDGVARFFHHQLTAAVAALVGEPVKPSYVYVASYQEGARLKRHVDREQCEFSISFCLDYSPEPRRATPWPLHLDTPSAKVTVFQSIGDGLLYRGCRLPHFRDPLPKGNSSTSIFFHYVREGFAGLLD